MGKQNEHMKKWEHNRSFLATLSNDQFSDWIATVAFYAAVHAVESVFAATGEHSVSHTARNETLRRNNRFSHIHKHFKHLHDASVVARYLCLAKEVGGATFTSFDEWMSPDEVKYRLINVHFRHVEQSVWRLLKMDENTWPQVRFEKPEPPAPDKPA